MARKKWTPKTEVTESVLQFREKRKWQIALRRYVLEQNKSSQYAPFFGIGIGKFREWIELQFDEDLNWENFSAAWQFDHLIPVAYFDFTREEDMYLCWNFLNIRVDHTSPGKKRFGKVDIVSAKAHFQELYRVTGYEMSRKLVEKIATIEALQLGDNDRLEHFLLVNKEHLASISAFSSYEYDRLNTGSDLQTILAEKAFLKKFG